MNAQTSGAGDRLAWYWLLLPALLAYRTPVFGGAFVNLQYFLIPVAALLGARFGLSGVIAVALGGLTFVVDVSGAMWGSFGGHPSLYLIALAVAALAATRLDGSVLWPRWPHSEATRSWLTFAMPFLLLLYLFMGRQQSARGGEPLVSFTFVPHVLAYFAILVLAARGARLWHLMAGLAAAAALSWLLLYAGLFPSRPANLYLDLLPLQPAAAITALAFFSAGACFRRAPDHPEPWGWWRRPYLVAVALLIIWLAPIQPLNSMRLEWTPKFGVTFFGSQALLPLAAFMLGALRGVRGAWVAGGITAALLFAGFQGRIGRFDWFQVWGLPLEAPFVAYAFGKLGAALVHAPALGADPVWRRRRFVATAWLVASATTAAIAGEGGALRIVLAIAFAALFCAAFVFGKRVTQRGSPSGLNVSSDGWITFLIVLCALILAVLNWRELARDLANWVAKITGTFELLYGSLEEALARGRPPSGRQAEGDALAVLVFILFLVAVAVSSVRKAWKDVVKVWRDLRVLYRYARLARIRG